jgi:molybdate transport system ATP-binding protein
MFEISLQKVFGTFHLDVQFRIENNILVLLGRSGSGKTLTLKQIAGFITPGQGHIKSGERILFSSKDRVNINPEKRNIGFVLQEPYLFPHLSIKKNLQYNSQSSLHSEYDNILNILDLHPLLDRMPRNISGGERQRVAIGRTLLSAPHILLMDEPVSSLDSKSKWKILEYIRQINLKLHIPIIYVTHSYEETDYLADDIGLMSKGKMIACGPKTTIIHSEEFFRSGFKNSFTNFYKVKVISRESEQGMYQISIDGKIFKILCSKEIENHELYVSIAAHHIIIMNDKPEHISTRNIHTGKITDIISAGESVILVIDSGFELFVEVTKSALAELELGVNKNVYYLIKASSFKIYD